MAGKQPRRILCVSDTSLSESHSIFTDLLYYEVILYRGFIYSDGDSKHLPTGYPEYLIKLDEADLIISPTEISKDVSNEYMHLLSHGQTGEEMRFFMTSLAVKKPWAERAINESDATLEKILKQRLDNVQVRKISNICHNHGVSVTPKYISPDFTKASTEIDSDVTSIIFSHLPTIESESLDLENFIGFITDDETQRKRRRLFSWQNNIEMKIQKGEMTKEHVFDLIATNLDDYTSWTKKSGLKLKYEKREFVYYSLASLLTVVNLPKAIQRLFQIKKSSLDLKDDEKAPGRELAYISHAENANL